MLKIFPRQETESKVKPIDTYLVGKRNIMDTVLHVCKSNFKEKEQSLVLDCGCGRGVYARNFKHEQYLGLDVNVSSVRLAHRLYPSNIFIVGSATELPFKCSVFDNVICSEVLEHIANDADALAELARVTKTPGISVVSVPNSECENGFVNWQRNLIDEGVGHLRKGYSFDEISKLFDNSGFQVKANRFDCGPVTAAIECILVKLGSIFGYGPSNLNQLVEEKKSLRVRVALKIYELFFPVLVLFTHFDRLLPQRYRSNMVIMAERLASSKE